MFVIDPFTLTDATLSASSVPETDHAVWNIATAYVTGNRVIVLATHSVYEAVTGSTGQNPVTNDGTHWIRIGATNRWKAFDHVISDPVTYAGDITYDVEPTEIVDAIAFFGLSAASVRLTVTDGAAAVVFDETVSLVDRTEAVTWFAWFYDPVIYDTEALITGFPGFTTNTLEIEVASAGTTKVGQIVMGRNQRLGETIEGTATGITDFSRKERDDFGRPIIVERAFVDRVDFQFAMPPSDARRVKRVLSRLRATPAVYYAGNATTMFGTTVFGYWQDFSIPLTTSVSFVNLEVEGLT